MTKTLQIYYINIPIMKEMQTGCVPGTTLVNVRTGTKYTVGGGYYMTDGQQFTAIVRLPEANKNNLSLGDYVCCMKSGRIFSIMGQPDDLTFVLRGLCQENQVAQNTPINQPSAA